MTQTEWTETLTRLVQSDDRVRIGYVFAGQTDKSDPMSASDALVMCQSLSGLGAEITSVFRSESHMDATTAEAAQKEAI